MCSNAGSGVVTVEPENDTARGRACRIWSCCHLYMGCLKQRSQVGDEILRHSHAGLRDVPPRCVIGHWESLGIFLSRAGNLRC